MKPSQGVFAADFGHDARFREPSGYEVGVNEGIPHDDARELVLSLEDDRGANHPLTLEQGTELCA